MQNKNLAIPGISGRIREIPGLNMERRSPESIFTRKVFSERSVFSFFFIFFFNPSIYLPEDVKKRKQLSFWHLATLLFHRNPQLRFWTVTKYEVCTYVVEKTDAQTERERREGSLPQGCGAGLERRLPRGVIFYSLCPSVAWPGALGLTVSALNIADADSSEPWHTWGEGGGRWRCRMGDTTKEDQKRKNENE